MADTTKTLRMLLVGEDQSASKSLEKLGDEVDDVTKKTSTFGEVFAGTMVADLAAKASEAIVQFAGDSVDAYKEAEAAQRQLEDAYARFPSVADVNIDKMRELNQAIQDKTGADADDIAGAQAKLAAYQLTGEQIAELTPLLDDYVVKTGKEIPDAADVLGKAMLGQGRALKDIGIDFVDTGSVAGNFEQVVAGLRSQVGGFAEQEATSAEGKSRILATRFGDVQEAVGEKLLPVLLLLAAALIGVVDFAQENIEVIGQLAAAVAGGALAYGIYIGITQGIPAVLAAARAAQLALNAAMAANPVGIVITLLGALVGAMIYAYNTSEEFRAIVDGAFQAIGAAGAWLWNNAIAPAMRGIVTAFGWVMDAIAGMLEALGRIPGFEWASDAAKRMRDAANAARGLASDIRNIPDKTVNITVHAQLDARGVNYRALGIQGAFASGGTAQRTGAYLVGEHGPEVVTLPAGSHVYNATETAAMRGASSTGAASLATGLTAEQFEHTMDRVLTAILTRSHQVITPGRAFVKEAL